MESVYSCLDRSLSVSSMQQSELTAEMAGQKPAENGGAPASYMQMPGGTGRETGNDFLHVSFRVACEREQARKSEEAEYPASVLMTRHRKTPEKLPSAERSLMLSGSSDNRLWSFPLSWPFGASLHRQGNSFRFCRIP